MALRLLLIAAVGIVFGAAHHAAHAEGVQVMHRLPLRGPLTVRGGQQENVLIEASSALALTTLASGYYFVESLNATHFSDKYTKAKVLKGNARFW